MSQLMRSEIRKDLVLSYLKNNSEEFFTTKELTNILENEDIFKEIIGKRKHIVDILGKLLKKGLVFRYRKKSNSTIVVWGINSKINSKLHNPFNNYEMHIFLEENKS